MTGPGSPAPSAASVLLVVGANGGCGASLLAGALALAWSHGGAPTWLVELDLGRGDRADAWGLGSTRTLDDLAGVVAELDARHLEHVAHVGATGVRLVGAPSGPGAVDAWDVEAVRRLVACARTAAGEGGRVVLDAGAGPGGVALAASAEADAVLIASGPTVAAARRARRIGEALDAAGTGRRRAVVLVGGPGAAEIGARAAARAAAMPIIGELPWVPGEADRLGAGHWPGGRRRRLTGAVEALAGSIA